MTPGEGNGPEMTIASITGTIVNVPRMPAFLPKTAHAEQSSNQYVILSLESVGGHIGHGEVTCSAVWSGEEADGTMAIIATALEEAIIGSNSLRWPEVRSRIKGILRNRPFLDAGLEMAILDLVGRTVGLPVHALLGGTFRDRIPTKFVLPARDPDIVLDMALKLRELNPPAVKIKVGTEPDRDVERVAVVRETLGRSVLLTVDANEGWKPEYGMRVCSRLEELGVVAVEQPYPRSAWRASAELRRATRMLVIGDESIWTSSDLYRAIEASAFDGVSVYPGKCGGLRKALLLAQIATDHGLAVTYGSNLELGLGSAALVHTAAATAELSQSVPSDIIGPLYFESSLITDDGFVRLGTASVLDTPGLGVELDPDALATYSPN